MSKRYTIDVSETTYRKFAQVGKFLNEPDASTAFDNCVDMAIETMNVVAAKQANQKFIGQAADSMLHPSNFDGTNAVFGPPAGKTENEVYSLLAARAMWFDDPCVISCWEPTPSQREALAGDSRVWLACMGLSMPPVCLAVQNPLEFEGVELR